MTCFGSTDPFLAGTDRHDKPRSRPDFHALRPGRLIPHLPSPGYRGATVTAPKSVLVVDDHPDIRAVLALLLEHSGFRVRVARDGLEAVAAVRNDPPDVILMDLAMPRMDGLTAARVLNENGGCGIPIVAVTARNAVREELEPLGFCGFLQKPVGLRTLVRAIRRCLDPRRAAPRWITR